MPLELTTPKPVSGRAHSEGATAFAVAAREPTSLRERAYTWLREEIVSGRLSFGAVLSPRRLGEQIGASFLPIADALQRLESEGLVESKDRVGTRVRVPTVADIEGSYTVREALESQAARLCCERATREQKRQLREMAAEVDSRYAAGRAGATPQDFWLNTSTFHVRFHRAIAEAADCPKLTEEIERSQVLTLKVQFDTALRKKERPRNWHRTLIRDILKGDPALADKAAREHIRYGMPEVIDAVRQLAALQRWRS